MQKTFIFLTTIIALGSFLRLYNLNWDEGHYLHPDERLYIHELRNPTSWEEFMSPDSPLNTKMFYYGPLPLYIYNFFHLFGWFDSLLLTSRFVSALFSILTIPTLFLVGKKIASSEMGLWAAFIFAVTPTSIQHAHFNTTESFLVFFLSLITLLSIRLVQTKKLRLIPALGVLMGFSFATKITALSFGIIPAVAALYVLFSTKKYIHILSICFFSAVLAVIVGVLLTPYYWIDWATFYEQQTYMQGVILGTNKPPFVIIYEGTLPYLYPLLRVLPFSFGFVMVPSALLGAILLIKSLVISLLSRGKTTHLLPLLSRSHREFIAIGILLIIFPLVYFAWSGTWYSKFSRYYMLLLPFFCLYSACFMRQLPISFRTIFGMALLINGLLFFQLYLSPHTRIVASEWFYQHTPETATIAFEHWDDALPLPRPAYPSRHAYLKELPVYNEPDTPEKIASLADVLAESDYVALSSRRVYHSILVNESRYPYTSTLYRQLFAGNLGFRLEKKFINYPYVFSDDSADESFQSYDHPPVHIFKKYETLSADEIHARIVENATR